MNVSLPVVIAAFFEFFRRIPAEDFAKARNEIEELRKSHERLVGKTAMLLAAESLLDHMLRETERNMGTLGEALADVLVHLKTRLSRMPDSQLRREVVRVTNQILGNMAASLREELGYIKDDLASAGQSSAAAQLVEEVLAQPHVLEELHKRLGSLERCRSSLDLLEAALLEAQRREEKLWEEYKHNMPLGAFLLVLSIAAAGILKHGVPLEQHALLAAYIASLALYTFSNYLLYRGASRLLDYAVLRRWFSEFRQLVARFRKQGPGVDCDKLFGEAVGSWKKLVG
ncbi:hypothetical protein Pyrde_0688 [Pyrodictium delaneyi]|uniref:Uncharacterized protein n=1 Tax=Pyrodictium delaneyi TaxID=1273541 RepID=A0A0P0N294_9CREN|nr:hypothetical protein [Pyrodictium delaneyi]ALL00738.1 hypothetical protein Pyrde_0688 [Pyrodictium delaneyi]